MPNRTWRSAKQPSNSREAQKPATKRTLEESCKDIKHTATNERLAKLKAESAAKARKEEEDVMAMTYGPNWRTKMPAWAQESLSPPEEEERIPFADNDESDEEDDDVVIPLNNRHRSKKAS